MGNIKKSTWGKGLFFVCADHGLVLDTPNCPHDPCIKHQSPLLNNCSVAGDFKTRRAAERWLCKHTALVIEAQVSEELEAA